MNLALTGMSFNYTSRRIELKHYTSTALFCLLEFPSAAIWLILRNKLFAIFEPLCLQLFIFLPRLDRLSFYECLKTKKKKHYNKSIIVHVLIQRQFEITSKYRRNSKNMFNLTIILEMINHFARIIFKAIWEQKH